MILDGDIQITSATKEVYSNDGLYYGDEEVLVLSVGQDQQDAFSGYKLNEVEITGW